MSNLILGDARETIIKMTDKSVDLIITDPMYDLNQVEQLWYQAEFTRVCKGAILVFCMPENQWPADKFLFWVKQPITKNYSKNFGRFIEMIAYYPGPTFNNQEYWANYTGIYNDTLEGPRIHEFQKPVSLIERFVRILSNEGDVVFDPFMGSGSIILAAKNLKRNYVGIEIDEATYEVAKQRIGED